MVSKKTDEYERRSPPQQSQRLAADLSKTKQLIGRIINRMDAPVNSLSKTTKQVDGTQLTLSIAAVERDTGLSKDTLRIWERRYGFPAPQRDGQGERAYPLDQVQKLRIVKRLLDGGHRPGRVVPLPMDALVALSENSLGAVKQAPALELPDVRPWVGLLRSHDVESLRQQLVQSHMRLGLSRFVTDVVTPLNTLIGDSWMRGQLEIFEEHLYAEVLQGVLRTALSQLPRPDPERGPRVLLTTFPGEPHGLGLLMAEVLFTLEGAQCVSLGVQTPIWNTVLAAQALRSDIIALGFTGCMNPNQVVDGLAELRAKCSPATAIWTGGAAPVLHRRSVNGVEALSSLREIPAHVAAWRAARPAVMAA
jgi:methanogenic corrinoid protein MtbC1